MKATIYYIDDSEYLVERLKQLAPWKSKGFYRSSVRRIPALKAVYILAKNEGNVEEILVDERGNRIDTETAGEYIHGILGECAKHFIAGLCGLAQTKPLGVARIVERG